MRLRVGDEVLVIAGRDKGKTGQVIMTYKNKDVVRVEGINMVKKTVKSKDNEPGQIADIPSVIHVSNLKKIETKKRKD